MLRALAVPYVLLDKEGIGPRCEMMPLWMEILVNVIGYAGFIGIATWHKSSDEITTDSPLRGHSWR